MPHPSEHKINVRVQTVEGVSAADAFMRGLDRIVDMAAHIESTFDAAVARGVVSGDAIGADDESAAAVAAPKKGAKKTKSAR